jgi:hypothetical protein
MTSVPQRICPGCGVSFDRTPWALDRDLRASPECWHAAGMVAAFTRDHPGLAVLDQLVRDTYAAQHAGDPTPPIEVTSSLIGLHLALDRGLDGPGVSAIQRRIGQPQPWWPSFPAPGRPAPVTIVDVLREGADAGSVQGHVAALERWAQAVWQLWTPHHPDVRGLTERLFPGGLGPTPADTDADVPAEHA